MLLTDVSFSIERLVADAPSRGVTYTFNGGSDDPAAVTRPIPNGTNVCVYVADRAPAATCAMAPPSPDCSCPCDPAWADFFKSATLSLVTP
jgi:hypothetical protein